MPPKIFLLFSLLPFLSVPTPHWCLLHPDPARPTSELPAACPTHLLWRRPSPSNWLSPARHQFHASPQTPPSADSRGSPDFRPRWPDPERILRASSFQP